MVVFWWGGNQVVAFARVTPFFFGHAGRLGTGMDTCIRSNFLASLARLLQPMKPSVYSGTRLRLSS